MLAERILKVPLHQLGEHVRQRGAGRRTGVGAHIGLRQQIADGVVGEGLRRRDIGGDRC